MKNSVVFIFYLFTIVVSAQQRQPLHGMVIAGNTGLKEKIVVNLNSQKETVTDSLGKFTLYATINDTLLVANSKLNSKRVLTPDDFKVAQFVIDLGAYELDEVVINDNINAGSLGLTNGTKDYTPAERRYKEEGRIAPGTMDEGGISISLVPVYNAITGKRSALKQAIETEKRQKYIEELSYLYSDEDITEKFYIPEQYIEGFIFYAVEDRGLTDALVAQDNVLVEKLMGTLAFNYLDVIKKDEK